MSKKREPSADKASGTPRLAELRRKLSSDQKGLLNEFWQHYQQHGKWPLTRTVHSRHEKQMVRKCLGAIGGDVVRESRDSQTGNHYELGIIGVLLTDNGPECFGLLVRYLEFLRKQFKENPERLDFTDKDFRPALNLTEEQTALLGELIREANLWRGGGHGGGSWSIRVPDEVEDLPPEGPLDEALEAFLFRRLDGKAAVFIEERERQMAQNYPTLLGTPESPQVVAAGPPIAVDALKRRYQVFVSSTYEDLKEERQHVIQALLETKCIPLGMELFPAASVEQWQLIKRVIEECDYYLVVVAGRYGSLSESGTGYTEMEFDYALKIGKPVIGFYHKSPDNLPGSKLEKTDSGRDRLKKFTEKVKGKLCRPWASPAELGSAVKSAILSELEFNPKPGWIRADAVPSSEAVEKLKQKIADLEEKLKKQKSGNRLPLAVESEPVQLKVIVRHDFKETENGIGIKETTPTKEYEQQVEVTWDEIILAWRNDLQEGMSRADLGRSLKAFLEPRTLPYVSQTLNQPKPEFNIGIAVVMVEQVLKTLMARRLVKMVAGSFGSWKNPKWRFTPKGLQHLAELQAIRKPS